MGNSASAMLMKGSEYAPHATDAYGFSAKIAHVNYFSDHEDSYWAAFWTASESEDNNTFCYGGSCAVEWYIGDNVANAGDATKGYEHSVRCVKDSAE
jgi:uncharacterized protein (TIGR02145 family)